MSKETIKMNSIRIQRNGIKAVMYANEVSAEMCRKVITANWDKGDDANARKALNKAHRGLAKSRSIINECQRQLRLTKRELRKLNRQHDFRLKALAENQYERTSLLG